MEFLLAFYEPEILETLASRSIAGRLPHLRLVSLLPSEAIAEELDALPAHLRDRVWLDPAPELLDSGRIAGILTVNPIGTVPQFPDVDLEDIITWDSLDW